MNSASPCLCFASLKTRTMGAFCLNDQESIVAMNSCVLDCSASVAGGVVGDYFHNYPHLGIDILYNSLHRASKVILKTNALGYERIMVDSMRMLVLRLCICVSHPDFGAYHKCNFRLRIQTPSNHQQKKKPRASEITPGMTVSL